MSLSMKGLASTGLLALLLAPHVLLILVIVGVVFLAISIAAILYYGLVTAIVLFVIAGIGILILHYIKAVDIGKQPWFLVLPFGMFGFGYFAERIQLFQIQPLWAVPVIPGGTLEGNLSILAVLTAVLILLLVVVAKRRK